MYNLKTCGGSYKGFVGEIMFKLTREKSILTRYWSRNKFFMMFGSRLTAEQRRFLYANWYSFDCLELSDKPILYEIKTKNEYHQRLQFRQKITENAVKLYEEAQRLGLSVISATIFFKDDWNYEVMTAEFDSSNYHIDKQKRYDAAKY